MGQLPVMETFLSIQGEGYHQGKLAYFIRLAGCDVGCSWCDVKESWSVSKDQFQFTNRLVEDAASSGAEFVVVTGGEPLMYDLSELTQSIREKGMKVHLETSGAYPLRGNFDWICLSPKKFKKPLYGIYPMAHELKIIVVNKRDLDWAEEQASLVSDGCMLYLQPEWDKRSKQYQTIYSYIASHPNWRISIQTHKYLGLP